MIEYSISFNNPLTHIVDIEVVIENIEEDFLILNLPAWRPGRYELANYAKNVLKFQAFTIEGNALEVNKISKDTWRIELKNKTAVKVCYNYYAYTMDAGNSWLDDLQLYINPINCLVYNKERIKEKCVLSLKIPASYRIATGLKEIDRAKFIAKDYYELVDCPIFSSPNLEKYDFLVNGIEFNIWIQGNPAVSIEKLIQDFTAMAEYQIKMMHGFPEKEYHFMFQFLPYNFRHGVEHRNSTVITIGPDFHLKDHLYNDLLGISSHELFHTWNVLKIRPKELMPYDFSKENYFTTGFIAEGVTTYYGDLLLVRSNLYSIQQYLLELTDLFQKHFDNLGNNNLSLKDSSFDLWLDGYVAGVPGRKVSIYIKGAVVAFLIDIEIRKKTKNKFSLDDIIRELWKRFGKPGKGYEEGDFLKVIKKVTSVDLEEMIEKCVGEATDLKDEVEEALGYLGLQMKKSAFPGLESLLGIKTIVSGGKYVIDQIHPKSPAVFYLSKNDEILAVNDIKYEGNIPLDAEEVTIAICRGNRFITEKLNYKRNKAYFFKYSLIHNEKASEQQKENLKLWLDQ